MLHLLTHQPIAEHVCYKNWDSNSQAMEADDILVGFGQAEKTHGLRYMWLVGDGDSSVYAKICTITDEGDESSDICYRQYNNR